MLQLKNIVKTYQVGDLRQDALKGVSVNFRDNEFVAVLGQSGSGKTTMLNIIGGLDRYNSGDLIINGVSTKKYRDADWDIYRNHKIGFVFQSYNLIPHQSVLSNVEMALTLSGVSKRERRERAVKVLKKVGLGDHLHKKPNQMSGGQMQRVAIARALINNPDILLADEPTGALDSETSIQIMDLLKEIAKDKLVIMVTHNPELAEKYSNRVVNLLDGKIVSDSNPYNECDPPAEPKKQKKVSMSFFTALSLSFNNLRTKKGRTVLTSFAGSIGIIGIALILALSTGMNTYISDIQRDTMESYPITIDSETFDTSSLIINAEIVGEASATGDEADRNAVYADYSDIETSEAITASITENNLTDFKKYLDDPDSEIQQYLGENGVVYSYDVKFNVYSYDSEDRLIDSDSDIDEDSSSGSDLSNMISMMSSMSSSLSGDSAANFSELMAGADGETVSQVVTDSYDMIYGDWPEEYNEVVLVLNDNNSISAETLYQLGLITSEQYNDAVEAIENGGDAEEISFDYADICSHTFYLVSACDHYIENDDGTFTYIDDTALYEDELLENATELKITGVIRPTEDADNADITTAVAYTSKLTDYIIEHTGESAIITAQNEDAETNVLTGLRFEPASDDEKIEDVTEYIESLGISEKASLYQLIMYYSSNESGDGSEDADSESSDAAAQAALAAQTASDTSSASGAAADESTMAAMLDQWLENDPDRDIMLDLYDEYIGETSYEENMEEFGSISYDTPSSISIYTDSFENKDYIADCIENYNKTVDEDSQITYTDYVALMTSSLTTIINGITYVLIAFVSISLIVSCIMIGIITHISVMERTKEIGILRALGASKRNISQVFNAETFIIGCCSGLLGVGISLLALLPINSIINSLTGIENLSAQLSPASAIVLILISIVITIIGGLIPAKNAAKKDPVVALRTE